MSNVVELIAYRASRENVAQLNEVTAHFSYEAKRPFSKSDVLRKLVADAHARIVRENS
jgi:hypothetical protein